MGYRMLVTDVDGTLFNSDNTVSAENRAAIAGLRRRGYKFTLATGRIEAAVSPLLAGLPVNSPIILYNGARLVDPGVGQLLFERHLSPATVEATLELLQPLPVDVNVYADGRLFVTKLTPRLERYLAKDGISANPVGDLLTFVRHRCPAPVTKLLVIGEAEALTSFRSSFDRRDFDDAYVVSSDVHYLEVIPAGCSKGRALVMLCEHLGIGPEEVVAIGDAHNDIDMLQVAGLGVAVANAHPDVRAVADYIAPSCDDHSVAHVIERFF